MQADKITFDKIIIWLLLMQNCTNYLQNKSKKKCNQYPNLHYS